MEDISKPEEPAREEPWLRIATGVLQFIGGGLVALHDEGAPVKAREPEKASERDIRERLEALGIKIDHADTIRRAWAPAPPAASAQAPSTTPPTQVRSIPTLSFDEFAAAAAAIQAGSVGNPTAQPGETTENAVSPQASPEVGMMAQKPMESPAPGVAGRRGADFDPRAELMEMRLEALEAKCRELQMLFMANESRGSDGGTPGAAGERPVAADAADGPALSEEQEAIPTPAEAAPTAPAEGVVAGETSSAMPEAATERQTVVHGPWAMGRAGAGDQPPKEPGGVYDAHEQRVAALERTFESFGRMVEGLAARPRGQAPPPE